MSGRSLVSRGLWSAALLLTLFGCSASDVSAEPTGEDELAVIGGLPPGPGSCGGTCTAACTMYTVDPPGQCELCCVCGGVTGNWKRSLKDPNTYNCK